MWIKGLALIAGALLLGPPALAAGIDSHAYSCAGLKSLITTTGFVYINNPNFADFVVANASYCGGGVGTPLQLRSVPTTDSAECSVNYCGSTGVSGGGGMSGGGM